MSLSISKNTVSALKYVLKIIKQQQNIFVVEGMFSFPLNITNDSITCTCNMSRESKTSNKSKQLFCKHIIYYLYYRGLDINLLHFWPKLKQHIFAELESKRINNVKLWTIVDKEIQNVECGYCSQQIKNITDKFDSVDYKNIHMCSVCLCFSHESCFKRWIVENNECIECKIKKAQEQEDIIEN